MTVQDPFFPQTSSFSFVNNLGFFFHSLICLTLQSALCISLESALRMLSVKIIWQNKMLAMEQQERFQGQGRQSQGFQARCLSLLRPSPRLHPCTAALPSPNCSMLTRSSQTPMCFGHEVRGWRRGNGNVIAGLGEQGNHSARK